MFDAERSQQQDIGVKGMDQDWGRSGGICVIINGYVVLVVLDLVVKILFKHI